MSEKSEVKAEVKEGRCECEAEAVCTMEVADSRFLGFVKCVENAADAVSFQKVLKCQFPDAAHVPFACGHGHGGGSCEDDGEPVGSAGPILLEEVRALSAGLAVFVVRFFGKQLLGVTCGRLPQCYRSVSRLALFRFGHPNCPQVLQFLEHPDRSALYGLGAGDTELLLDVVEDPRKQLMETVRAELEWGGFRGNAGEVLPRLQNMQASTTENAVPVYRYPGNYTGDEWQTFPWGHTSSQIRSVVERNLLVPQTINHCVANLYRDGNDFIDHHSDKDLDLDKHASIVSFSLGSQRIFELKRRAHPHDITRIALPHSSMLVLGPKTNQQFTHSILKHPHHSHITNNTNHSPQTQTRISLTFRNCTTMMDKSTKRLVGQGSAYTKTFNQLRNQILMENALFGIAFAALSYTLPIIIPSIHSKQHAWLLFSILLTLSWLAFTAVRTKIIQAYEEQKARHFFSKRSATGLKY